MGKSVRPPILASSGKQQANHNIMALHLLLLLIKKQNNAEIGNKLLMK